MLISPLWICSRILRLVRKSSFSFFSAMLPTPLLLPILELAAALARGARIFRPPMSKAFVKENDHEPEPSEAGDAALPPGGKNYITPAGFARLKAELARLVEVERPEVVKAVSWAASLGDRSENADYIYGKRRLREIDR